ncbi:MAG: threonylcarbamoyl-AMP synthase [Lentisphaerae bacterium]|nr:threonylcarbamoyl-AMP synthase [Lentisphaerota bacterium]
MEDAYFRMVACDEHALGEVARILNAGGVAVIPTDTVYGLAAHPAFPQAVDRLYTIKGREAKKPIALLAADAKSVTDAGFALSGRAAKLARDFWPGALTMVLARDPSAQGGAFAQTEGFRVPAHGWTRRLITACGGVLRVTSANLSGAKAATDAKAALEDVGLSADIVVDDGESPGGVASTVVRFDGDSPVVLRQGAVAIPKEGSF